MATAAASEGIYEALLIEKNSEAKEKRWSAKNLGFLFCSFLVLVVFVSMLYHYTDKSASQTRKAKRGLPEEPEPIKNFNWAKAKHELFKSQILVNEVQQYANGLLTMQELANSIWRLTGKGRSVVTVLNTLKAILRDEGIGWNKKQTVSVKNEPVGKSFINWYKAPDMIWKWANGKLDLIKSVEARKELYEKAHDPNTRASEKLEVSKCAIIKFGERHRELLEEMKQHATYESYKNSDSYKRWVIDDNNNFITEENNETATRKRLSTTDSLQDCEPSTSACTTKRSRQSPGVSNELISIGAAYRSGFLNHEAAAELISGTGIDASVEEVSDSMKRTGFDLVVKGFISPKIGPTAGSNHEYNLSGAQSNSRNDVMNDNILPPQVENIVDQETAERQEEEAERQRKEVERQEEDEERRQEEAERQKEEAEKRKGEEQLAQGRAQLEKEKQKEEAERRKEKAQLAQGRAQVAAAKRREEEGRRKGVAQLESGVSDISIHPRMPLDTQEEDVPFPPSLQTQSEDVPYYVLAPQYPSLTEEDYDDAEFVLRIWKGEDASEEITAGNSVLQREDIESLQIGNDITINIVIHFFRLLIDRSKLQTDVVNWHKNIEVLSPLFFSANFLQTTNNQIINNPFRKEPVEFEISEALTFFPLFDNGHYALIVFEKDAKKLRYYDSLLLNGQIGLNRLAALAKLISNTKDIEPISCEIVEVPQQTLNDSGVGLIVNAERLASNLPLDYSLDPEVIQFLRMRIAIIILRSDAENIHIDIPRYSRVTSMDQALLDAAEEIALCDTETNNEFINMFSQISSECNDNATGENSKHASDSSDIHEREALKTIKKVEEIFEENMNSARCEADEQRRNHLLAELLLSRELSVFSLIMPSNDKKKALEYLDIDEESNIEEVCSKMVSFVSHHWSKLNINVSSCNELEQIVGPIERAPKDKRKSNSILREGYTRYREKLLQTMKENVPMFSTDDNGLVIFTVLSILHQMKLLKFTKYVVHFDRLGTSATDQQPFELYLTLFSFRYFYTGVLSAKDKSTCFYKLKDSLKQVGNKSRGILAQLFSDKFTTKLACFFQRFPLDLGIKGEISTHLIGDAILQSKDGSLNIFTKDKIWPVSDEILPATIKTCPKFLMVTEKLAMMHFFLRHAIPKDHGGLYITASGKPNWTTLYIIKMIESACEDMRIFYLSDPNPQGWSIMNSYKYGARSVEASRPGGSGASYSLRATAPFAACNKMHWLAIKPSQLTSILPTGASGSDISLQDKAIIHNLLTFYTTLPNKEFANELEIYIGGRFPLAKEIPNGKKKFNFEDIQESASSRFLHAALSNS